MENKNRPLQWHSKTASKRESLFLSGHLSVVASIQCISLPPIFPLVSFLLLVSSPSFSSTWVFSPIPRSDERQEMATIGIWRQVQTLPQSCPPGSPRLPDPNQVCQYKLTILTQKDTQTLQP